MKKEQKITLKRREKRIARTRRKILARRSLPRLTVFRSNKYIYAQIIDDNKGATLVQASEKDLPDGKMTKIQKATELGKVLAKKAVSKKIKNVVFDKGAYKYHGRVKALAEAVREGGLVF